MTTSAAGPAAERSLTPDVARGLALLGIAALVVDRRTPPVFALFLGHGSVMVLRRQQAVGPTLPQALLRRLVHGRSPGAQGLSTGGSLQPRWGRERSAAT